MTREEEDDLRVIQESVKESESVTESVTESESESYGGVSYRI